MSSTGREDPELRAAVARTYAPNVAARRTSDARTPGFIHFGHWDSPPTDDELHQGFEKAQERLDDRVLEIAQLRNGQQVVDVGCGFGGTIAAIDARWHGMSLTGINIDPAQLALAAASVVPRGGNTIAWIEGDATELTACAAASVDRMLAIECIPHFSSRRRFLANAARVLRPGGRLALSDFVPTRELRALRGTDRIPFEVDRLLRTGLAPWPDFWGDDTGYEALAASASLVLDHHEDVTVETLPSYRAILAGDEPDSPQREAMRLLEWLQTRGLLRMVYAGLRR